MKEREGEAKRMLQPTLRLAQDACVGELVGGVEGVGLAKAV